MPDQPAMYATCVFLKQGETLLLARKTCRIGKGFLNGFGGRIERGEEPIEAAIRELNEETGAKEGKGVIVSPKDLKKIAIVNCRNQKADNTVFVCQVHVYLAERWQGELAESDEMKDFSWHKIESLPWNRMMPADKIWLPLAIRGHKIIVYASLGLEQKELSGNVTIKYVDQLPEQITPV